MYVVDFYLVHSINFYQFMICFFLEYLFYHMVWINKSIEILAIWPS